MNKKLTKLEIEKEAPEIATASYANRSDNLIGCAVTTLIYYIGSMVN